MRKINRFIKRIGKYISGIDNKELMKNLFIILIIGIIFIIIANIFFQDGENSDIKTGQGDEFDNNVAVATDYETILESKLEYTLNQLRGVGTVKAMITLEDSIERIPAFNTTKNNEITSELDSQGGTREISREDKTIQVVTGSEGSLIILKEVKPTVKGVIIIAEGAENIEVKERIYEAVKTVLGVPGNKVEVYASK